MTHPVTERNRIMREMQRQLDEIIQYFNDVDHWNSTHPRDDRIDPDPDGRMAEIGDALRRGLQRETGRA